MTHDEYVLLRAHIEYKAKELVRLRDVCADERQDLEHELYAQILKAENSFNPNLSAYPTYADMIADNAATIIARRSNRHLSPGFVSLCTPKPSPLVADIDDDTLLRERRQIEKRTFHDFRTVLAHLSPQERRIAVLYLRGYSKRAIAQKLGMKKSAFCATVWRKFCENARTALKDFH